MRRFRGHRSMGSLIEKKLLVFCVFQAIISIRDGLDHRVVSRRIPPPPLTPPADVTDSIPQWEVWLRFSFGILPEIVRSMA